MTEKEKQMIKEKKRFLKRYRKNQACIERLEEKLLTLDESIKTVKPPSLSGMPRGGIPTSISDLISDKEELSGRILRMKEKGRALKSEILVDIDALGDSRYCMVLESYFIDGLSLEEIAELEGYTTRHTYRLYSEAVRILALRGQ
ncbi:hypothetical protein V1225_01685 [Emergencia sp. JLR.KK010]|uniref:hypothetical protein n=1 Tax=Emergencia sp. JLR.KK010 TaxID=3114296 RepID=UPI0030D11C48